MCSDFQSAGDPLEEQVYWGTVPQILKVFFSDPPCSPGSGLRAFPKARGPLNPFHGSIEVEVWSPLQLGVPYLEFQLQLGLEKGLFLP